MKPTFMKKRVLNEIKQTFPDSKIINYKKLKEGLVSPTYKVKIKNPKKFLVVKIYKKKNSKQINTNIKIMQYLYENKFPIPKVYSNNLFAKQGILIMEHISGKSGLDAYNILPLNNKKKLLFNLGKLLKKMHNIDAQKFWIHYKHNIETKKEWVKWIALRINKYLSFIKKNMPDYYSKLKHEFNNLSTHLKKQNFIFVPMHWDFHLSNIRVNDNQDIIGIFDFDNALRGDALAEIAQFEYWLRLKSKSLNNIGYFLKGYGLKLNRDKQEIIKEYFLLHLIAVNRSIWKFNKRLSWLIKEHKIILDEVLM